MTATTTSLRIRFEELIERAETEITKNPKAYKRKLALLALLGYGYLFGILIVTLALIALCIYMAVHSTVFVLLLVKNKVGIVLVVILFVLLKALWVRLDAPSGLRLDARRFPNLFRDIEALRKRLQAPKIHEILISSEFNAGIQQTPRFGVFGCYKNSLILGLPLLLGLSRPQCLSVIAHEFGHLAGAHNRFDAWIYRVRTSWWRIMEAFDQAGGTAGLVFGKFFDWYAPYFNAYSFALARANEYQADEISARLTSNSIVASALVQTSLLSDLLNREFWGKLDRKVAASARVHESIYTELKHFLETNPFSREQRHDALKKLLKEKTGHADTHPSLFERIQSLTDRIPMPRHPEISAAQELLGKELHQILKHFDSEWAKANATMWVERHDYLTKSEQELTELENSQKLGELAQEDHWKLAAWTEEFRPLADPLSLYLSYWHMHPDEPRANYAVGRLMLERGDADGLIYLLRAMRDPVAVIDACQLAYEFHSERGNGAAAEDFRLKAEQQMDLFRAAEEERSEVSEHDDFQAHDLNAEAIQMIRSQLQAIANIDAAWLCRKKLTIFPDDPLYILVCRTRFMVSERKLSAEIVAKLKMPGAYFVFKLQDESKKLTQKALPYSEKIL